MARCSECGAPVESGGQTCDYCGASLQVIGAELGARILKNTEALLHAAPGTGGGSGFTLLNTEEWMPVAVVAGATQVECRLDGGTTRQRPQWPHFFGLHYRVREGDDLFQVAPVWMIDRFAEGADIRWVGGRARCERCTSAYHMTQTIIQYDLDYLENMPAEWLVHIQCPVCKVRFYESVLGHWLEDHKQNRAACRPVEATLESIAALGAHLAARREVPIGSRAELDDMHRRFGPALAHALQIILT